MRLRGYGLINLPGLVSSPKPSPLILSKLRLMPTRSLLNLKLPAGRTSPLTPATASKIVGRGSKKIVEIGPTNLIATDNGDGQSATLTWNSTGAPGSSAAASATSFDLSLSGGTAISLPAGTTSYVLQGLTPGVAYTVTLTAYAGNTTQQVGSSATAMVMIGAAGSSSAGTTASAPVTDNTVTSYDANGNPLNAEGQIVPGAPSQSEATNGTTSNGGSSDGSSGSDCSGVVSGYDGNGNPIDCNGDPVSGASACGGTVVSYDQNGNPLDCNGLPVDSGTACGGVVAGYDANGNPIDCNGLPVSGAQACGGVEVGTDDNGNPVDCNGLPVGGVSGGALQTAAAAANQTSQSLAPPSGATTASNLLAIRAASNAQAYGPQSATTLQMQPPPPDNSGLWWLIGGVVAVGVGAWYFGGKKAA